MFFASPAYEAMKDIDRKTTAMRLREALAAIRGHEAHAPEEPGAANDAAWAKYRDLLRDLWSSLYRSTAEVAASPGWLDIHQDMAQALQQALDTYGDELPEPRSSPRSRYHRAISQLYAIINERSRALDESGLVSVMLAEVSEAVAYLADDWAQYESVTRKVEQALDAILASVNEGGPVTHPNLHAAWVRDLQDLDFRLATDGWRDNHKELSRQMKAVLESQKAAVPDPYDEGTTDGPA